MQAVVDKYCRVAIYRYEYTGTDLDEHTIRKDVYRRPYSGLNDLNKIKRHLVMKTYDNMYDYIHSGIYDPIRLKLSVLSVITRSSITYNRKPLFNMVAGVVYVYDSSNIKYKGYPIYIDKDNNCISIFDRSEKIKDIEIADASAISADLEKAYEIVDNYIIGNKYKIGNNNNQIAINGFKDK